MDNILLQIHYSADALLFVQQQVCHIAVEMIRGSKVLGDWFSFCRDVISGGGEQAGDEDEEAGAAAPKVGYRLNVC